MGINPRMLIAVLLVLVFASMPLPALAQKATPEASEKVRKGNYERIFNEARRKVRSWEAANVK